MAVSNELFAIDIIQMNGGQSLSSHVVLDLFPIEPVLGGVNLIYADVFFLTWYVGISRVGRGKERIVLFDMRADCSCLF